MDTQNQQESKEQQVTTAGSSETGYNEEEITKRLEQKMRIEKQLSSGAGWFYWIAGLSIINTITFFFGWNSNFIIGLGITQVIDSIAYEIQGIGRVIAVAIDISIAGVFIIFGINAYKGKNWGFIVGMIIYLVDALIFIFVKDWIGIAFHALALYGIFNGLRANKILKKMETSGEYEE